MQLRRNGLSALFLRKKATTMCSARLARDKKGAGTGSVPAPQFMPVLYAY